VRGHKDHCQDKGREYLGREYLFAPVYFVCPKDIGSEDELFHGLIVVAHVSFIYGV
jgi:hypothetical protein